MNLLYEMLQNQRTTNCFRCTQLPSTSLLPRLEENIIISHWNFDSFRHFPKLIWSIKTWETCKRFDESVLQNKKTCVPNLSKRVQCQNFWSISIVLCFHIHSIIHHLVCHYEIWSKIHVPFVGMNCWSVKTKRGSLRIHLSCRVIMCSMNFVYVAGVSSERSKRVHIARRKSI